MLNLLWLHGKLFPKWCPLVPKLISVDRNTNRGGILKKASKPNGGPRQGPIRSLPTKYATRNQVHQHHYWKTYVPPNEQHAPDG